MVNILILSIYWNPPKEIVSWPLPFLGRPLLWYGFFFALGFFLAYRIFQLLLVERGHDKKEAKQVAEKASLFIGIAMIAGARLFEMLFYQRPSVYLEDPLELLRFWEGGLSSHGAVIGILVGLWLLQRKWKERFSWRNLLDLLVIPGLVAGSCIRIGNFFNQEIFGTVSTLPWAVLFGTPADGSAPLPRHPVQLYEALFYLFLAALLWKKRLFLETAGKLSGLFFICCFSFRFCIEFLKTNQSALIPFGFPLDMGQLLSLPLILLGLLLIKKSKGTVSVERN